MYLQQMSAVSAGLDPNYAERVVVVVAGVQVHEIRKSCARRSVNNTHRIRIGRALSILNQIGASRDFFLAVMAPRVLSMCASFFLQLLFSIPSFLPSCCWRLAATLAALLLIVSHISTGVVLV